MEAQRSRLEIGRLDVLSVAKIAAVIYAVIAVIPAIFVALGIMVGMATSGGFPARIGPFIGVLAIIVLPIFYGVLGFVFGALSAWVYNLVASRIGGIIIETRQL